MDIVIRISVKNICVSIIIVGEKKTEKNIISICVSIR